MAYWRMTIGLLSGMVGLCLALPCILACLPFWGIRWMTKKLTPIFSREAVIWKDVIEFEGGVGWKAKPNLDVMCDLNGIREYHVKTDSRGFRGHGSVRESDVVVFGDSFAFAHGVDDEKAFFGSKSNGFKITSIGSPGYNMVQETFLMEELASELKGKLVVWFIYLGNDLHDNLYPNLEHYRTPFVRQNTDSGRWEIVDRHVRQAAWPFNAKNRDVRYREKHVATFGNGFLSDRVYGACEFLVKHGRDICRKASASLVILTIPTPSQMWSQKKWENEMAKYGDPRNFDPQFPDRKLKGICLGFNVPLISAKENLALSDLIPMDAHWNEKGNAKIGKLIQKLFSDFRAKEKEYSNNIHGKEWDNSAFAGTHGKLSENGSEHIAKTGVNI